MGVDDELFEGGDVDEDGDDEETLQLKLQAIQAQLRLKRLKAAKARKQAGAESEAGAGAGTGMREVPLQSKLAAARDRLERQAAQNAIQVPASPIKRPASAAILEQTSPQRLLLGIDKGRKAADVSLKKAPSQRKAVEGRSSRQTTQSIGAESPSQGQGQQQAPRPLSFNERLAAARNEEKARQEKKEKIQGIRSTAFSVGKQEMEEYKSRALEIPDIPLKAEEFSREQVLSSIDRPSGGHLERSSTVPNVRSGKQLGDGGSDPPAPTASDPDAGYEPYSGLHLSKRILPHTVLSRAIQGKKAYVLKDLLRHVKAPDWSLPDVESDIVVYAIVASKSEPRSHRPGPGRDGKTQNRGKYMVLTLVDLKFEVELFLFNSGFDRFWKITPGTVLAILNPTIMPPPPGREATNRFSLVINSDADTILEIGNARDIGYCKSIKKDGTYCKSWVNARRTEYCEFHTNEAVRKARGGRMELNSTVGFGSGGGERKFNSHRIYVQSEQERKRSEEQRKRGTYDHATQSHFFVSSAHRGAGLNPDERENGLSNRQEREEALKRRLAQKEKEREIARRLGELGGGAGKIYMNRAAAVAADPTSSTTTTSTAPRKATKGGREGELGSSFSSATPPSSSSFSSSAVPTSAASSFNTSIEQQPPKWDARSLGLVGRRGADQPKIDLGPVKRKRAESAASSSTAVSGGGAGNKAGGGGGLGWGSMLKDKLGRMREGERLDGRRVVDMKTGIGAALVGAGATSPSGAGAGADAAASRGDKSPVRKKTRFVTDKGIREAGRDSLGESLLAGTATQTRRPVVLDDDDEDDDDLIIVK
jgi:minichromosome maintenance protein 10